MDEDLVKVYTGGDEWDGFLDLGGTCYIPDNGSMKIQELCEALRVAYPAG